ncbi:indolepyruvate ferredoxin oxidoreductase subunit beta [Candidatus Bathyarchaeota archaeon]|nr:indolepyruvate ferredoxin oxidoreductase subunit beta [Candidatus Bathyarchaeota archaeon]
MSECNIVLAGVGGQGVLLLSEILGRAALESGYDVRVAEIHGMAQRGGSVTCTVRIGERVYSPTFSEGEADIIIALEPAEAIRNITFANPETLIIMNTAAVPPPGIYLSNQKYPDLKDIIVALGEASKNILVIDALSLAERAGNPATQNIVMLGLLSATGRFPVGADTLRMVLAESLRTEMLETNIRAFNLGFESFNAI